MKTFTLFRHALFLFAGLATLVISQRVSAQVADDPNRDQIPFYLRQTAPKGGDLPLSTVITIGNYDNFNLGVDFGESNMAENPLAPPSFFTAYNTNAAHHTENGLTWTDVAPSFGATMQGDPVVGYDSLGNLFYENMYGTSSIQGCKILPSSSNGASWGASVTAIAGVDKNWMACDQTNGPYANYVYTTMTASSGGNFARSTDHGVTFSNTWNAPTQSLPGMMVCVGPNSNTQGGSVYVVTNSGGSFASTYTFYRSTNGGSTFTQMSVQNFSGYVGSNVGGRNSVQNMRTRPYPMIASDNSYGTNRGRLYCVYASNDPPGDGNKPDIWCRYSADAGATWSTAVRVNDDANPTTHHQWHPAIWCDKQTGRLYAMWMDTRDCPTNDSALIYASYSDNGGTTWVANQAISNQKMKIDCPTCGGGGTPRYQGDYNGIVSNKKVSMAGWTDFRSGSFMSVTGYFPDFAVAVTPATGNLYVPSDSIDITVNIPSVKLYSDTVIVSATITPPPATGTFTISYPQGSTITTFPGSKIVRVKLTGNVPLATYQVAILAKGPNGTPVHQRNVTLTTLASQTLAVAVTATPNPVCSGQSTQLQASASGGSTPYTYIWTSNPAGFTSSLPSPVASPTVNTRYICTVNDNAAHTAKDSVMVTISAAPGVPGAISGNTAPCMGALANYNIASVAGATTYTWTVPSGAIITSGQGTTAINVTWGATSGDVAVTSGNSCGNSTPSQLAVNLIPTPGTPGPISGPSTVCSAAVVNFSVPAVTGVTNNWTVPSDATITSGQGTPAITVQWGISAGFVTVDALNGTCLSSPASQAVNVEVLPTAAQSITGPDTVCKGISGYIYSIPSIPNASTYVWDLPAGVTITQGAGTSSITVDVSNTAVTGTVKVAGSNLCGVGPQSELEVTVMVCTGIDNNRFRSQVRIYPNPVRGTLSVALTGGERSARMEITDLNGRKLYEAEMNDLPADYTRQIDVSSFAKGVYLLRLTSSNGVFVGKFTVE